MNISFCLQVKIEIGRQKWQVKKDLKGKEIVKIV